MIRGESLQYHAVTEELKGETRGIDGLTVSQPLQDLGGEIPGDLRNAKGLWGNRLEQVKTEHDWPVPLPLMWRCLERKTKPAEKETKEKKAAPKKAAAPKKEAKEPKEKKAAAPKKAATEKKETKKPATTTADRCHLPAAISKTKTGRVTKTEAKKPAAKKDETYSALVELISTGTSSTSHSSLCLVIALASRVDNLITMAVTFLGAKNTKFPIKRGMGDWACGSLQKFQLFEDESDQD
ncbi:hypothetical protein K4K59_013288 [Colletotrichum sp. SAR11_240]|nr:hypothetical protein K4K59_013288 [Colletotrichum sp. SAR11_240]